MLRARLATAAVAIPLLLLLIFIAPTWAFAAFIGAVAAIGVGEYVQMAFPAQPRERGVGLALGTIVVGVAVYGPGPAVIAALDLMVALGLVWAFVGRKDFERGLTDAAILFAGILYVGLLLPHFVWLRELPDGPSWVTVVVASSMLGDSSGYFIGHAWGRHKLAPRVSPGKSVEGALGIVAGSVVAWFVGKVILLRHLGWAEASALGLFLGVLSQLGDLSESAMKRTFGAKESGWIFPGHGGVLDRIDSLLFPVAFVYYYVATMR